MATPLNDRRPVIGRDGLPPPSGCEQQENLGLRGKV